jgi:hypothetical protein
LNTYVKLGLRMLKGAAAKRGRTARLDAMIALRHE